MTSKFALTNTKKKRFIILLQPRFVLKDLLEAIDWFKSANEVLGKIHFEWFLCSEEGPALLADNGMVISAIRQPKSLSSPDSILVFTGNNHNNSHPVTNKEWLLDQHHNFIKIYHFHPFSKGEEPHSLMQNYLAEKMAEIVLPSLNKSQNKTLLSCLKQTNGLSLRVTDSRIHKALSLMRENIEIPLDSQTIASQSYLSLRQLERLFKQYFDESPSRHYTKLRLSNAKTLLLNTDLKVGDVSQACGFSTLPYFCKAYRDCFGISPLQSKGEIHKQISALNETHLC
jgi:transcriptional regulator GlxA family with amidase domain